MIPSIYPKAFLIDTSKISDFYKNLGIQGEPQIGTLLDENSFVSQLTMGDNIKAYEAEIKKLLEENINEEDITFIEDVKYSVNGEQVSANKYRIVIPEAKAKVILKSTFEKISKDEDLYKIVFGKYVAMGDLVKQLGLDDGRLDDIDKKVYFKFITDIGTNIDKIIIGKGITCIMWVDQNGDVVGRNYEMQVVNDKGNTIKITLYYNKLDMPFNKYSSLELIAESIPDLSKNIQYKSETITKIDQLNTKINNVTDSVKIVYGVLNQKNFISFELMSDKANKDDESKRKYQMDFLNKGEKGNFKMNISAVGTERGADNSAKLTGDYNVIYDIAANKPYKGKFDMKYDTLYTDNLELPVNSSPILSKETSFIDLNKISQKEMTEIYLNIQLKFKSFQRKTAQLFEFKEAGRWKLD
jgi:hypothetical protein